MEFALSTHWNAARHARGEDLIEEILGLGFTHVELGYDLRMELVEGVKAMVARQAVKTIRRLNRTCAILVRCRYQSSVAGMKLAGADAVVSEESEATAAMLRPGRR